MLKSFQAINQKLRSLHIGIPKRHSKEVESSKVNQSHTGTGNNNNQNTAAMLNDNTEERVEFLIQPGFYRNNSSTDNDETQDIIRVMQEDRPGYWRLLDGRVFSDYEIQESYYPVDFQMNTKPKVNNRAPKHLFAGLGPSDEIANQEPIDEDIPIYKPAERVQQNYEHIPPIAADSIPSSSANIRIPNTAATSLAKPADRPADILDAELTSVLERLKIGNVNDRREGKEFVKNLPIPISFDVTLGYDIVKLKQAIELLDLDVDKIAKYLAHIAMHQVSIIGLIEKQIAKILVEKEVQSEIQSKKENLITDIPEGFIKDSNTNIDKIEFVEKQSVETPAEILNTVAVDTQLEAEMQKIDSILSKYTSNII